MIKTYSFAPAKGTRTTLSRQLFSILSVLLLLTACKKESVDDNNDGGGGGNNNPPQQQEGYFPSKTNTLWNYTTEDADGVSTHTLSVVGTKDSAGGKVIRYESVYSDGNKINPYVYTTAGQTTYAHTMPTGMQELLDALEAEPAVSNVVLEGVPMLQQMPRNPQANDAVTFSAPFRLGYTVTHEGEQYNFGISYAFSNGKVVGFEDVTTPAGTFKNCLKWQYTSTLTSEGPTGVEEETSTSVLWFAKGVGLVKGIETQADGATSTTVLKSISNK